MAKKIKMSVGAFELGAPTGNTYQEEIKNDIRTKAGDNFKSSNALE